MGAGGPENPPHASNATPPGSSSPCGLVLDPPGASLPAPSSSHMMVGPEGSSSDLDDSGASSERSSCSASMGVFPPCPAVHAPGGSIDKSESTQVFGGGLTTDSLQALVERLQHLENQVSRLSLPAAPVPRQLGSPGYPLLRSMDTLGSDLGSPTTRGATSQQSSTANLQCAAEPEPADSAQGASADVRRRRGRSAVNHELESTASKPTTPRQHNQQATVEPSSSLMQNSMREELRRSHRQCSVGMPLAPLNVECKRRSSITKLKNYLWLEIFGAQEFYEKEEVASKANTVVNNFIHVPFKLEECLTFGLALCTDSFLYAVTFLPLRVFLSALLAFTSFVYPRRHRDFHRNNAYDLMRGLIVVIACLVLQTLQISRVYHYIRGQATIKLYVLTAMFEILDKLMISFGQDTLDSLYWSAKKNSDRKQLALNFVVSAGYGILHALLLFVHVVTMFVAVNSSDQALLTLLISNNFAEMKTSVFKRFETKHLFQLTCSDMVERFKLSLFLFLISILNVVQHGSADKSVVSTVVDMFWVGLLIFAGEVLADCIKHAFITKYNDIDAACYDKYTEELAKEVTLYRREKNYMLDHTHVLSKKVGLAQLPLAAVAIRFLAIAWAGIKLDISYLGFGLLMVLLFFILVLIKIISGLLVAKWAVSIVHNREKQQQQQQQPAALGKDKKEE